MVNMNRQETKYLAAMQAYLKGKPILSDAEFDSLKAELKEQGSQFASSKEPKCYIGTCVVDIVLSLIFVTKLIANRYVYTHRRTHDASVLSLFAIYSDTGICTVTYQPDNFRNNLLYLPVGVILSIFWLGFGFEVIEPIIRLNPLILAALGAPLIYNGSISLTSQFIFPNNKIVYGPCPACETETRVYFGDILGVEVRERETFVIFIEFRSLLATHIH